MVKKEKTEKERKHQIKHDETAEIKTDNSAQESMVDVVTEKTPENEPALSDNLSGEPETETTDKMVAEIASAQEKLAEIQDKYLRLSAEFDNYRKRTLKEKMDLVKYADENLLRKLVPFMDDFERALKAMEKTEDSAAVKDGIDLIHSRFRDFLNQNGVKEIDSANCIFNVDLHEAVAKVPVDDEDKKGKVVDVVLKGYYLQDKVLRFSKVIVGE
jgi:molecular chaperone GrpE